MVYTIKSLPTTNYLLHTKWGWKHKVELEEGIRKVFEWYRK